MGVDATSMYLALPDGVEVDASLAEVSMGVVERQTLINGMNSLIEQQTQIFQAMMYLGLMFTIAVMFNTMIMNVAERDFELATLRVLGASTRSLGLMLLFESLLIGIIGGLVGVAFAYGGAVGLGHPLAATGTRLVLTLAHELRRSGGRYGVATACIGGGQGIAMVIEAINS